MEGTRPAQLPHKEFFESLLDREIIVHAVQSIASE